MRNDPVWSVLWPDPLRTASAGTVLFVLGTPVWPAFLGGVAALSALAGVIALGRVLDPSRRASVPSQRLLFLIGIGTGGAWAAYALLPGPMWDRGIGLAAMTLVLALEFPAENLAGLP
jgi:hypothetical protein